jgi:hypothetical protein
MVDRFFENYLKLVDTDASLLFHSNVTMEWEVLRIEALQNLTVITAALLLILLPQGYVSPGNNTIYAKLHLQYLKFYIYPGLVLKIAPTFFPLSLVPQTKFPFFGIPVTKNILLTAMCV